MTIHMELSGQRKSRRKEKGCIMSKLSKELKFAGLNVPSRSQMVVKSDPEICHMRGVIDRYTGN